jgi:Putative collagen-binding domain of a collagenase
VAINSGGTLALIFDPQGNSITLDMSKFSGSTTARWYDPTNGTFHSISGSPFANSGSHQFTTPGANSAGDSDWVLLLDR